MTTYEFIDHRCDELRTFFRRQYGRHWIDVLNRKIPGKKRVRFFINRERPSSRRLNEVEQHALSLGFKPSGIPPAAPERKTTERIQSLVNHSRLVAIAGVNRDRPNLPTILCAMAYYKLKRRVLKDDVFPQEFLDKWVQVDRTNSPVHAPEPHQSPAPTSLA